MQKYKFIAPLLNYSDRNRDIEITTFLSIRHANEQELKLLETIEKNTGVHWHGKFLIEYVLETDRIEKKVSSFLPDAITMVDRVITLLRLLDSAIVGYFFISQCYGGSTEQYSLKMFRHHDSFLPTNNMELRKYYYISEYDEESIVTFLRDSIDYDESKLSLALHYFNQSYFEPYKPTAPFLDLMIALENLFLRGESQELGYKLRVRASLLLRDDLRERKILFDDLKLAYSIRGKIVHGGNVKKLTYELLFRIRDIVRESLFIFFQNPELLDDLDSIVIGDWKKINDELNT